MKSELETRATRTDRGWQDRAGMQILQDRLVAGGADLSGWTLVQAYSISDDGLTIVGVGTRSGNTEAWFAVLDPTPPVPSLSSFALATLCTLLGLAGLRRLRG
jgi:hypothetical protein